MRPKELMKTQRFVHRHFVPDAAPIAPALSAAYRHQGEIPLAGAFAAVAVVSPEEYQRMELMRKALLGSMRAIEEHLAGAIKEHLAALAPPSALGVPPQPIARNGYAAMQPAPPRMESSLNLVARALRAILGRG